MPNNYNNDKILKEIKGVSEYLDLSEFVIEKDLYVTQAISIVSKISHDLYKFEAEMFDLFIESIIEGHADLEKITEQLRS